MDTYTIHISDRKESSKLRKFLKGLTVDKLEISKLIPENPATVHSFDEYRDKIASALESVAQGKFIDDEDLDQITAKWQKRTDIN